MPADSQQSCSPPSAAPLFRKLSVLMPVHNERWTLAEVVERVLRVALPLELELIIVDDASSDGSSELADSLAAEDSRIHVVHHPTNRGKGAAIRSAIAAMTGDLAVVQDADLEYDPAEFPLLLQPILEGKADAVYGSRFAGHTRRVLNFWHSLINRSLTLCSNMLNDLNLTDMETCYKVVRADILKRLRLKSNTFTIEPELTCRLSQWGARIYEVPISYFGRSYQEGKKIHPTDGLKALWAMLRCRFLDPQFTDHDGLYTLSSTAHCTRYNQWILDHVQRFVGNRVLEAGSGIGSLSGFLLNRERLVLTDKEPLYTLALRQRFGRRGTVRIDEVDLTRPEVYQRWRGENLDTIFCSNVLEYLKPDRQVLDSFYETLAPGGHCVLVVPAGGRLFTPIDSAVGHHRRYDEPDLREKLSAAGFEVVHSERFSKLGAVCWALFGHVLRRRTLSHRQMIWFDRLMPLAKLLERLLPVRGLSLVMIGRKPEKAAGRMAA